MVNYYFTSSLLKKTYFSLLIVSCLQFSVVAQNADPVERCSAAELYQQLLDDPTFRQNRLLIEEHINNYKQSENQLNQVVTIPVVFHVIHNGEAVNTYPNINKDLICAQLDQMNDDFRAMNSNINDVLPEFQDDIGDMMIQFCFAAIDPDGNATDGILRYDFDQNSYSQDDFENNIKPATIWNRDRYFNIWTAELQGGLLGYAQFPGGAAETDGIVNIASSIGSIDMPNPDGTTFRLGRTATHEAGHFFDLFHIWGDDCIFGFPIGGGCNGSDQVADTPNQQCNTSGAPTGTQTSCGSSDMYQNYMDYTNDSAMALFSKGQATRSQATVDVGGFRRPLATSNVPCTSCGTTIECESDLLIDDTPIAAGTYGAGNTITSTGTVLSGTTVTFEAGQSITLEEDFVAQNGSTFTARIQACTSTATEAVVESRTTPRMETNSKLAIFPNPTSEQTTLQLTLAQEEEVSLELFDLTGRKITAIAPTSRWSAGEHNFLFDTQDLESGIYIVVIRIGEQTLVEKLSVLR